MRGLREVLGISTGAMAEFHVSGILIIGITAFVICHFPLQVSFYFLMPQSDACDSCNMNHMSHSEMVSIYLQQ